MVVKKQNCETSFLDAGQYSKNGILRYERIFGHTFVSTGGLQTTQDFVAKITLKPGMKVLDIGCGTGGSAFYMARKFGVEVMGLDLSENMLAIANEHKLEMEPEVQNRVTFRMLDATKAAFPPDYFDVMYSRDAIMHIADKDLLYSKVFEWLKPGGQVLVSEYVHGKNHPNHPKEYLDYLVNRGYQLVTVDEYANVFKRAGFSNVKATDLTKDFIVILKSEMEKFEKIKASFIKDFSSRDYNELMDGWKIKVNRCSRGDQGWGLFQATKL